MKYALLLISILSVVAAPAAPAGPAAPPSHLGAADQWLHTIVEAARAGDHQALAAAIAQYVEAIRNAAQEARLACEGSGPGPGYGHCIAAQRLKDAARRHLQVLQGVLERVPEQAKPAIRRAIEAASHGFQTASEALQKAGTGQKQERHGKKKGRGSS